MANAGTIQVVQHHADAEESERKVTWLEFFYDLIYVATLIQLGNTPQRGCLRQQFPAACARLHPGLVGLDGHDLLHEPL